MLKCIVNEDGTQEYIEYTDTPSDEIITVDMLKNQFANTDYKIIKCMEYSLAGLELPYDITSLHAERQEIRDKINQLEGFNV